MFSKKLFIYTALFISLFLIGGTLFFHYTSLATPQQQKDWKRLVKTGQAVGVDVRTSFEIKMNPTINSVHIPLADIEEMTPSKVPDKSKTLLLFCESGVRSNVALKKLRKMGYEKVIDIKNWRNWNDLFKREPSEKKQ